MDLPASLRQFREQHHLRGICQLSRQRQIELRRHLIHVGRERDPDRADRVIGHETIDIGLGRQLGWGDFKRGGLHIERLSPKLPVKILRVFAAAWKCKMSVAAIAERKRSHVQANIPRARSAETSPRREAQ